MKRKDSCNGITCIALVKVLGAFAALTVVVLLGLTGCQQVDEHVKPYIGKVYNVIVKADIVLDQVEDLIAGSELADEIADDIAQVRASLQTVKNSLETLAAFLGVDLDAAVLATDDALKDLERATKELDEVNATASAELDD